MKKLISITLIIIIISFSICACNAQVDSKQTTIIEDATEPTMSIEDSIGKPFDTFNQSSISESALEQLCSSINNSNKDLPVITSSIGDSTDDRRITVYFYIHYNDKVNGQAKDKDDYAKDIVEGNIIGYELIKNLYNNKDFKSKVLLTWYTLKFDAPGLDSKANEVIYTGFIDRGFYTKNLEGVNWENMSTIVKQDPTKFSQIADFASIDSKINGAKDSNETIWKIMGVK